MTPIDDMIAFPKNHILLLFALHMKKVELQLGASQESQESTAALADLMGTNISDVELDEVIERLACLVTADKLLITLFQFFKSCQSRAHKDFVNRLLHSVRDNYTIEEKDILKNIKFREGVEYEKYKEL